MQINCPGPEARRAGNIYRIRFLPGILVRLTLLLVCLGWHPSEAAIAQNEKSAAEAKPAPKATDSESSEKKPASPVTAIVGADIVTMAQAGTIDDGVLLIQDGRVLDVGPSSMDIPEGSKIIALDGQVLTPGWIDAQSALWKTSAAVNTGASDASLQILDGTDPFSEDWHEVVAQGVTAVCLQPSSRGTLGGFATVVSTVPDAGGSIEVLAGNVSVQASLGISTNSNRTRSSQYSSIKKVLDSAMAYKKKWDEYNEYEKKKNQDGKTEKKQSSAQKPAEAKKSSTGKPAAGQPTSRMRSRTTGRPQQGDSAEKAKESEKKASDDAKGTTKEPEKAPEKPDKDPVKENLVRVIEGEIPFRLEIHTADDAFFAKKLRKEFPKLLLVLQGMTRLGSAEEEVLTFGAPVILGPWLRSSPGYQRDPDFAPHWGKRLSEYKGSAVLTTSSSAGRGSKLLRAHVAAAIASGLAPETALESVTIQAARVLGVADQVGSIEQGKRADIVAFGGTPTDNSTPISAVWVGGAQVIKVAGDAAGGLASKDSERKTELLPDRVFSLPRDFAIQSTRCLQADGSFAAKVIQVRNGVISKVGEVGQSGAEVIDLGDAILTPGLFGASGSLGLASAIDPSAQSDASYVVAADAVAGTLPRQETLVHSGLLQLLLTPGDSNPIAGSASFIRVGARDEIATRRACMKFVLTSSSRSASRFPSSLAGQIQFVEQSLAGKLLDTRLYLPGSIAKRLDQARTEQFEAIATGKMPVLLKVNSDAEIRGALDLVDRLGLSAALTGANQLQPFLARIQSLGVEIIASPVSEFTYDWYVQDLVAANAAGISVSFAGEDAEALRLLAGQCVQQGMPVSQARKTLFHGPRMVSAGGLSEGQPANFVIWSGSPLSLAAKPVAVVIDGTVQSKGAQR